MDFLTIDYLKSGNQRQRKAFEILTEYNILSALATFDAVLVGTIPINIDIQGSDLDIICYWKDKQDFIETILLHFNREKNFSIREIQMDGQDSVVANFIKGDFEIEIFGQNIPVTQQNGYRHMLIEHEILQAEGEDFRQQIIQLKEKGYKTEPAFGVLLGLTDPYYQLLHYKIKKD